MLPLLAHPPVVLAALLTLVPFFWAAFCPQSLRLAGRMPVWLRLLAPALLGLPYALVSGSNGVFRWTWLVLYTLLPVLISVLLYQAGLADPEQRGDWRDYLILVFLGLAVDLRWFEPAWGPGSPSSIRSCCWMPASMVFWRSGSWVRLASTFVYACAICALAWFGWLPIHPLP